MRLTDSMLEMSGIELRVRMYKLFKFEDNYNENLSWATERDMTFENSKKVLKTIFFNDVTSAQFFSDVIYFHDMFSLVCCYLNWHNSLIFVFVFIYISICIIYHCSSTSVEQWIFSKIEFSSMSVDLLNAFVNTLWVSFSIIKKRTEHSLSNQELFRSDAC